MCFLFVYGVLIECAGMLKNYQQEEVLVLQSNNKKILIMCFKI